LSAKDKDRLAEMVVNFYDFLVKNAKADVRDICYTANTGRGHYGCRLVMIAANRDDLTNKMKRLTNCSLSEVNVSGVFYGDHKIISQSKKNRSDKEITESEKREFSHKADEQINRFIQCGGQDKELLTELCNLYINGADIDWEKMYSSEMVKKVSLPGYPFERTRCWLTIPDQAIANEKLSYENFYYTMGWCKEPIRTAASVMTSGSILLLKDQKGMGVQISKRLHQKGLAVIEVEIGDHYQNKNECCFTISSQEADFERMFDEIGDRKITQVIHLSTLNGAMVSDTCELQRCQERGVNSLIFLTRVLVRRQPDHELDTVLVSSYVNEVTGQEERISPENAPLLAFGRVINKEHPQMGCRGIDIDDFVTPDDLMAEMNVKGNEYISALRKGERFVEEFKPLYPEEFTKQEVLFCEEGVYIITGGTGGMGLAMAQYMAARSKIRVALINRSQMPPFEQWEKILQSGQDKGMCQKIRSINVLKAYGAEVLLYSANVAKEDEMQTIFRDLKTRFGRINGVIHAAGVGGSGMIANRSKADADEIISPKVYGTFVIDKLTREEDLDFFVMCSSVSSMFSAPAQGDYMSANAYQDAYAAYRNKLGKRTLTINWTTWKEVGMAANHNATFDTIFKALPTARAMSGFDQVFHRDIKRVLLGEIHYKSKMIHILERFQFKLSDLIQKELLNHRVPDNKNRKSKSAGSSAEVILMGKDSGEYLEVERKLAKITQEVLGFDEIDVYESFFEMGADSILLTRMYNDLDKEFPDQLTLVDLFSYTTISELALFLMGRDETDFDVDDEVKEFEAMFEKIEEGNLSIDEALENIYNQ
jgi:NAD(P)-dependent dehydrogenase (short-subunit alcohol dehydrogenase family)/acyl carrier protein